MDCFPIGAAIGSVRLVLLGSEDEPGHVAVTGGSVPPSHPAGLCRNCRHHRLTGNRRGSLFYLCERSKEDARFPRYPPLPVLTCTGYEEGDPDPWAEYEDE